jgi:hypothetical protein
MRVPYPDARKEEDSAYRAAWGRDGRAPWGSPLRAAFYQYLPEVPIRRYLGLEWARRYVAEIQRVLDREEWTRDERNRLKQLKKKWQRRADNQDARYNRCGTLGGREGKFECRSTSASARNAGMRLSE